MVFEDLEKIFKTNEIIIFKYLLALKIALNLYNLMIFL